jgi:hypothetical protein
VLNALLGGWQLNGNLTLQSGFPVPFPNAAPVAARSAKVPGDQRTHERWYDTSLWRDPATGRTVPAQAPFTLRNFPTRFPDVRFASLRNLDLSRFKDNGQRDSRQFRKLEPVADEYAQAVCSGRAAGLVTPPAGTRLTKGRSGGGRYLPGY